MNTRQRAQAIAEALKQAGAHWQPDSQSLLSAVELELGHTEILDHFVQRGPQLCRALPPSPLLHILSGTHPEAALQSLSRGLLLGASTQWVKLPSQNTIDLSAFLKALPTRLRDCLSLSKTLPDHWLKEADAVIAFGTDESMAAIQSQLSPKQKFMAHGHKLSIAVVDAMPGPDGFQVIAQQVHLFDQLGCLSTQQLYLSPNVWPHREAFVTGLSQALQKLEIPARHTAAACRIQHARTQARLQAAFTGGSRLIESPNSTAWTLLLSDDSQLHPGPGYRFLRIAPLPESLDLGPEQGYLSCIGLYPFTRELAEQIAPLPAARLCPIQQMQTPSIHWHQDGYSPLAALVRWQDMEF